MVATGSSPWIAPIDGIGDVDYETSETILERRDLPESVVIIGGGYVAMEWGQILHHMDTGVTLLQRSSHVLSEMWEELGRDLQSHFREEGITVATNTTSIGVSQDGDDVLVEASVDGEHRTFTASNLFVATGVEPNTADIGLDTIDIETDDQGAVVVDEYYQTENPDVYAAGDCIGSPMLETIAAKEDNHASRTRSVVRATKSITAQSRRLSIRARRSRPSG